MRKTGEAGFTRGELIAVLSVLALLAAALFPAVQNALLQAEFDGCGQRGRDVYVALSLVNTEREPRGEKALPGGRFASSTELFRYLVEEEHAPRLIYRSLSGCGVPPCEEGQLKPENNMWTVVKEWRDELEDVMPVMLTRNIDASSLPFGRAGQDRPLRLDPEWQAPFGDKGCVIIRKGGAIFKARSKYATPRNLMGDKPVPDKPVRYLTPSREVVAGERGT